MLRLMEASASPHRFVCSLTVRTYELDGFRHVNNAVFVQYLEAARGEMILSAGLEYADFHRWEAYPVVARLEAEYFRPAHADDDLEIECSVVETKRTRFTVQYRIRRIKDDALILRASTVHAFVRPDGKPVRVPAPFRAAFGL